MWWPLNVETTERKTDMGDAPAEKLLVTQTADAPAATA
jgi:hypothetical protein